MSRTTFRTSPRTTVPRVVRRAAPVAVAAALVSGCAGSPARGDFVGRANGACAHSVQRITDNRPATPGEALPYAISVFEEKDQLLSWLRSIRLPSGDARVLRARWLTPAQRDLRRYFPRLVQVRRAVQSGDQRRVSQELDALARSGRQGVDAGMLSRYGLTACRDLFAEPEPTR